MSTEEPTAEPEASPVGRFDAAKKWFKRLGLAGFLFFLIKGLAWLIVPAIWVALR